MTAKETPRASHAARRGWRAPIATKLVVALVGLVVLVLLVNSAINTWLGYDQAKSAALEVQREQARAASDRVGEFLAEIETQLGWTTGAEWRRAPLEQRRYDFIRLLRQAPAITELSYLDGEGKEQLKVSRLEPDALNSGQDFSTDPRFVRAVADKIWFGPVEFRRGSEPYMTIALAHVGKQPGVTVADVNLKLIWDVINAIHVGEKGYAFIVDGQGRLIAHPDLSLVLRGTDFSKLPQVSQALANKDATGTRSGVAEISTGFDGASVLTAYATSPRTHWIVFVQSPLAEALATVYKSLWQTLALLGLGLVLALIVGGLLARRLVAPIRRLQRGAERLGAGDLSQRLDIRTGDEIETLADRFNQMAGSIQESYDTLEAKVETRTKDLNEALERQTATAEILKVIASSPGDTQPVFEAISESAMRLLGGSGGVVFRFEGDLIHVVAATGIDPVADAAYRASFPQPRPPVDSVAAISFREQGFVEVPDTEAEADPRLRENARNRRIGSYLAVPLVIQGNVFGLISVSRKEKGKFPPHHVALLKTFADQAVIAIQNARLFNETQEALKRQTATAEILKVIASSPDDTQPVFEAIVASAKRLLGGRLSALTRFVGDESHLAAFTPINPEYDAAVIAAFPRLADDPVAMELKAGRAALIEDTESADDWGWREGGRQTGFRSAANVPLVSQGTTIGGLTVNSSEPGAFDPDDVELLRTFADQAVIAIENVRLLNDTKEALERQTATAEILKVIASSPADTQPVFQAIADSAKRLLNGRFALVTRYVDDKVHLAAFTSLGPETDAAVRAEWPRPLVANPIVAAVLKGRTFQIVDANAFEDESLRSQAERIGTRSSLTVPLARKSLTIGSLTAFRSEPGAFAEDDAQLLRTFADQAIIAIENARLLNDIKEALQQQTATADVLKVISRSAFDLQTVFDTLISSALQLCGAFSGSICVRDGEVFRYTGSAGVAATPALHEYLTQHPATPGRATMVGRVLLSGKVEHIRDRLEDEEYAVPTAAFGNMSRAFLGVPLLGKAGIEGALVLTREDPGYFSDRQVEIVQTFADQAVIALENVRLFEQVQARTRELAASLDDLRKAQDRLVQSEKLASLGQLTAGIAHEIKNPLNFVNNFSALTGELADELLELLADAPLEATMREEVDQLAQMIKDNLKKVVSHGKRADSIVKNMLLHSRSGVGEHRPSEINAIVEESLNLAYHGARAETPGFNITLKRDLDPSAGAADVYPQEISRALLNLISNGFYAATKRREVEGGDFEPTLSVQTINLGDAIEVRVRDNGTGIPDEVREKIFNPFFTTKPAGEGTGLGLSMTHDIVVKQHGGTLDVESSPGDFTEFKLVLPRGGAKSRSGEKP